MWCVRVVWLWIQNILEPPQMDLYIVVAVGVVFWRSNVPLSFIITHLPLKNCYQIHRIVLKEIQLEKFISPCHMNITIKFKVKLLGVIQSIVILLAGLQSRDDCFI